MIDLLRGVNELERFTLGIASLFALLHLVDTLSYSIRLNSIKSGQFALSTSLFNTISLVTRVSNTLFLPAIGALVGNSIHNRIDPIWDLRPILFGATIGACLGAALTPTFLKIFGKAVNRLERVGSVPILIFQAFSVSNIRRIPENAAAPRRRLLSGLRFHEIPKRILLINVVITAVYTVGVLASNYAAIFVSEQQRMAVAQSSGVINSVATILLTLLIDPRAAAITDQTINGKRPYGDVKALVAMLIVTKIVGTVLAQLIFIPSAHLISLYYR